MLDARRAAFVQQYVWSEHAGNATASYVAAGYSPRGANRAASLLLTNIGVQAAVAEATAERDAAIKQEGIARLDRRMELYNQTVNDLLTIRGGRAADPTHRMMPGGESGLLTRRIKSIPNADPEKPPLTVTESMTDTGWVTALLNTMKQAAQDSGQWSEGRGGETTLVVPVQVNVDSNAGAVSIAERAYIAALRGERVVLGEAVYEAQSPDPGADAV